MFKSEYYEVSKYELLQLMFNRMDVYGMQRKNGIYLAVKKNLTGELKMLLLNSLKTT